jgi:hypothetical protein
LDDLVANRDGVLLPFSRLRATLDEQGLGLETADRLFAPSEVPAPADYYSLGITENFKQLVQTQRARLRAFVIYEPPVVAPHLYRLLPELTRHFEHVYVHNVHGDGYSLAGVDQTRLRKLYFPQPFADVLEAHWGRRDRLNKLVVINGNKRPKSKAKELYSKRIEGVAQLARRGAVDLYGHGWGQALLKVGRFRYVLYPPAFLHRKTLASVNRGPCGSKYETLSRYKFCLCFENMEMDGYITEKLIDCLYAGTVPVYWGAPDITDHVPAECFIDFRQFRSYDDLWAYLQGLDDATLDRYRQAGRQFLASPQFRPFFEALSDMLKETNHE